MGAGELARAHKVSCFHSMEKATENYGDAPSGFRDFRFNLLLTSRNFSNLLLTSRNFPQPPVISGKPPSMPAPLVYLQHKISYAS